MKLFILALFLALVVIALAGETKQNQRKHIQRSIRNVDHKISARTLNNQSASAKLLTKNRKNNREEEAVTNDDILDIDQEPDQEEADGGTNPSHQYPGYGLFLPNYNTNSPYGFSPNYTTNSAYDFFSPNYYANLFQSLFSGGSESPETRAVIDKTVDIFNRARRALVPIAKRSLDLGRAVLNQAVISRKSERTSKNDVSKDSNNRRKNDNVKQRKLSRKN